MERSALGLGNIQAGVSVTIKYGLEGGSGYGGS
jgi:hypothetical protein